MDIPSDWSPTAIYRFLKRRNLTRLRHISFRWMDDPVPCACATQRHCRIMTCLSLLRNHETTPSSRIVYNTNTTLAQGLAPSLFADRSSVLGSSSLLYPNRSRWTHPHLCQIAIGAGESLPCRPTIRRCRQ
jgi:hypothetical protein